MSRTKLSRYDTVWGNIFNYVPLKEEQIRVLTIENGDINDPLFCHLHHVSFPRPANQADISTKIDVSYDFTAVSYVWGSELKPCLLFCCSVMDVDGSLVQFDQPKVIPITANLDTVLRKIRSRNELESSLLWIDAVSIDQNNVLERSSQVLRMGDIYSTASRTFICLNDDENDSDLAITCIDILRKNFNATQLHDDKSIAIEPWLTRRSSALHIPELTWKAFEKLLKNAWFTRIWVFQEAVLSRHAIVLYNGQEIPWQELQSACLAVQDNNLAIKIVHNTRLHVIVLAIHDTKRSGELQSSEASKSLTLEHKLGHLESILANLRDMKARDPRDKVYAVLGVGSDMKELELTPDYSVCWQTCYVQTFEKLLQHPSIPKFPLRLLYLVEHEGQKLESELPSWCPDWRKPHQYLAYIPEHTPESLRITHSPQEIKVHSIDGNLALCASGVKLMKIVGFERSHATRLVEVLPDSIRYPIWGIHYANVIKTITKPDLLKEYVRTQGQSGHCTTFWQHYIRYTGTNHVAPLLSMFFDANAGEPDIDLRAIDNAKGVKNFLNGRRLFVTDLGFVGLATTASRIGDEICCLYGGPSPYVLRKDSDAYRFVGDCWVAGIMDGEAMVDIEPWRVVRFTIY